MKIDRTVANSKLLVESTKQSIQEIDNGELYQAQFTLQTPVIGGLNAKQLQTFLNKCREALSQFKDELVLRNMGVLVEQDQSAFNEKIVEATHNKMIAKLGPPSGKEESQAS